MFGSVDADQDSFDHRPSPPSVIRDIMARAAASRGPVDQRLTSAVVSIEMSENKTTRLVRLIDELAEAAKRVGLEVRREKILREVGYRARGGACRLREQDLLILDREQAPADQIEVLAEALRGRDLEQVYLSPAARRVLQTGPE